jgi:hypothetical protein
VDEPQRDIALTGAGRFHVGDLEPVIGGGGTNRRGMQRRSRDEAGAQEGARRVRAGHVIESHFRAAVSTACHLKRRRAGECSTPQEFA